MAKAFKKLQVVRLTTDFEKAVEIVEASIQVPNVGEVLVRNLYSGVNATDINISGGKFYVDSKPPFDIGFESLGVVESVGVSFKTGDVVIYIGSKGYSEYMLVQERQLLAIDEVNPEYLGLALVGLTSAIGLREVGKIQKGETVLITAAAGGTGQIAVQWAKSKGCHVIGTCSSLEKSKYLKSIGCDFVINYKEESIDEVLSENYPNGVDLIWETIGGEMTAVLFKHLATKGRMIILGAITTYKNELREFKNSNILESITKSKKLLRFLVLSYTDKFPEYFKDLVAKYKSGEIKVKIDMGESAAEGPFIGIASVPKAVNHLHSGKSYGKVMVKVSN